MGLNAEVFFVVVGEGGVKCGSFLCVFFLGGGRAWG